MFSILLARQAPFYSGIRRYQSRVLLCHVQPYLLLAYPYRHLLFLADSFNLSSGDSGYNELADIANNDNLINILDMVTIGANFGEVTN